MRYPPLAIVLILSFAFSANGNTVGPIRRQATSAFKEDIVYWDRFMTETSPLSISRAPTKTPIIPSTPPPTPPAPTPLPPQTSSPVNPPTPPPVPSPTPPPVPSPTPPPIPSPTLPPIPSPTLPPIPSPTAPPLTPPPTPPSTPSPIPSPTLPPIPSPTPPPIPSPTSPPLTPPPVPSPTPPPIPSPTLPPIPLPTAPPLTPPPTPPSTPSPIPSPTLPPISSPTLPPIPSPTAPPLTPPPTPPSTPSPIPSPTLPPIPSPTPPPIPSPTSPPLTPPPTTPPTLPPVPSPTPPPITSPTLPPLTPPPTPPLTPSPILSPTPSPITTQTPSPTSASTISPACAVELNLECRDANGTTCDDIFLPPVNCRQSPEVLTMMYNGGGCGQSFNIQPSTLFQCFDLRPPTGAGPPPLEGRVYIEARSSINGTLKFAGFVGVHEQYNLTRVDSDTSILVRQDNGTTFGRPMQLINFHTSCDQNLFLRDRFGAQQVAGWINELQGVVNSDVNVTYSYNIANTGTVNAELVKLNTSYTPPEPPVIEDLTDLISGEVLEPGRNFNATIAVTIDLTTSLLYTILGDLLGKTSNGGECSTSAKLQFYAGTPVPGRPNPPLPSSQPTIAPAPTPVPGAVGRAMMVNR